MFILVFERSGYDQTGFYGSDIEALRLFPNREEAERALCEFPKQKGLRVYLLEVPLREHVPMPR